MSTRRGGLMLVVLVFALASGPATAGAAKPVRGATYVGSVGGKQYLELPVSRDGRRIFDIIGAGLLGTKSGTRFCAPAPVTRKAPP